MAKYFYQTVQSNKRIGIQNARSGGSAVGAGVQLFHSASVALNGWSVSFRVNRELEKISDAIQDQMPPKGGVLVCVGIIETGPIPTRAFLGLHIAGSGQNVTKVLRKYHMRANIVKGPPKGWKRKDTFIWVTAK